MQTEQQNPATLEIDTLSTGDILRLINEEDRKVAQVVQAAIPQLERTVEAVVAALRAGGRLFYVGAGAGGHRRR